MKFLNFNFLIDRQTKGTNKQHRIRAKATKSFAISTLCLQTAAHTHAHTYCTYALRCARMCVYLLVYLHCSKASLPRVHLCVGVCVCLVKNRSTKSKFTTFKLNS